MALRFAFVLLVSIAVFGLGNAVPAFPSQKCGANAEFRTCGSACEPTCAKPIPGPICTLQCVIGCFCTQGFLMNGAGECVRPTECDATTTTDQPIEAAMLHRDRRPVRCPANEEFRQCKGCDASCQERNPLCPRICIPGCACKEGHVRSEQNGGQCIPVHQCPVVEPTVQPVEAVMLHRDRRPVRCPANEEFQQCKKCDDTCFGPLACPKICQPGCVCREGHVRMNADGVGQCIPVHQCPIIDPPVMIEVTAAVDPVDGKCAANEVFHACGSACAPTCQNPHPSPICTKQCVIGCYCQEGFLRNHIGVCVPTHQCQPAEAPAAVAMPMIPQCPANEFFNPCGSACAASCENPNPSPLCTKNCVPACFCREGLLRNERGECVQQHECKNPVAAAAPLPPPVCGENEVPSMCKLCDATCDHPAPLCKRILTLRMCRPGCACKEGHVRNADGQCIAQTECPKTAVTPFDMIATPAPQKCGVNEEFSKCGSFCPATCANPHPLHCTLRCKVGCFCKKGFLKNAQGVCVPETKCEQH